MMSSVAAGFTRADSVADPDRMLTIDRVTLRERKLFFATAQVHLKNGCPLLALEVMTRLPPTLDGGGTEDECQSQVRPEEKVFHGHYALCSVSMIYLFLK